MPFHVYFASNWKESVNDQRIFPAQYGFGFTESGAPRLPEKLLPDALRIIDDAILPKAVPDAAAFRQLAHQCSKGFFFDFERTPTQMHTAMLRGLSQELSDIPLLIAAERFAPLCTSVLPLVTPPPRCANWLSFAAQTGAHYPKGWVLELIPYAYSVQMPFAAQSSGRLQDALCCYRQTGKKIRYFDTYETLSQKLAIAQEHACCAAIGLLKDLQPLLQSAQGSFHF